MKDIFIRIKAIVKQEDKYLVLEHWMDDCIVEPFMWEFIDFDLEKGESPVQAAHRGVYDATGLDVRVESTMYTWSQMIGEMQCVGIAFLCEPNTEDVTVTLSDEYSSYQWIGREEIPDFIQNPNLLKDLKQYL